MEHTDLEQWLIPAQPQSDDGALLLDDVFDFSSETCSMVAADPCAPHLLLGTCEAPARSTAATPFVLMDSSVQLYRPVLQLQPLQSSADATGCSTWIAREAAQRRGPMPTIAVPPAPSAIVARCNALAPFRTAEVGASLLPPARPMEPKEPPAPKQYVHPQPPVARPSWAGPVTASAGVQVTLPQPQASSARAHTAPSPTAVAVNPWASIAAIGSPASDNTECTPTLLLSASLLSTPKVPESTDKQFEHLMRQLEMSPGDPDMCTLTSRSSMLTSTSGSENSSADVLFVPQSGGTQLMCTAPQPTPCMLQPTPNSASAATSSSYLDRYDINRVASVNGPTMPHKSQLYLSDPIYQPPQAPQHVQHTQHMQHMQLPRPSMLPQHSAQPAAPMAAGMGMSAPSCVPAIPDSRVLAPPPPPAAAVDASPPKKRLTSKPGPSIPVKRTQMKQESTTAATGVPAPVRPRKSAKRHSCWNCGAHSTPQWRCGPDGPRTLCNACGVRYKKGLPLKAYPYKDANGLATRVPPPPALVEPAPLPAVKQEEATMQVVQGPFSVSDLPMPATGQAMPSFSDNSLYGMFDFAVL